MRQASIRDLRNHASKLVREASEGEVIIIERRGEPVAELRPICRPKKPQFRDMSHIWNTFPQLTGDSTDLISEDRGR